MSAFRFATAGPAGAAPGPLGNLSPILTLILAAATMAAIPFQGIKRSALMANNRFRDDRERERYRNESERGWRDRTDTQAGGRRYGLDDDRDRDDDGYIARRGFGNESAGYDRRYDAGR